MDHSYVCCIRTCTGCLGSLQNVFYSDSTRGISKVRIWSSALWAGVEGGMLMMLGDESWVVGSKEILAPDHGFDL